MTATTPFTIADRVGVVPGRDGSELSRTVARLRAAEKRPTLSELRRTMPADDAMDVYLGRADWTRDDYVNAGREEFDNNASLGAHPAFSPYAPQHRETYVRKFVEMHMPRSKWGVS